jgi:ABC-type multidrug transport system permease subunit
MPRALTLEVAPAGERQEIPTGFEQAIPGTMVMFTMFMLLTTGAVTLVIERRQGLLRRLASTPIDRGGIVLGKWGGRMALGLVQIAFAMLAGTVLFGMDWGPDLPIIFAVLTGWAALCASLGLLLGNLASTEGQAIGIGVLTANVLAALGGCWWPIEITPGWMQTFSKFLPTGWAMDAMHRLVSFQSGPASVLPHLAALAALALIAGWVGARRFRFQ